MKARKGDLIRVDSERAGEAAREGEVLEVLEAEYGTRYRVRWDDGHESTIHPVGGTAHVRRKGARGVWQIPEHAR